MKLESVKIHERHKNVVEVTNEDLSRMFYLVHEGLMEPGYVMTGLGPDGHQVDFFIPLAPGSFPVILGVKCPRRITS